MPRARLDLSVEEARERFASRLTPRPPESVAREDALDQVLAGEIIAPVDLPRYDNSAMDGYAVRFVESAPENQSSSLSFDVIGTVEAGSAWTGTLDSGCALRIGTGAAVPAGADAVLPAEDVELRDRRIRARALPDSGTHIRRKGEDIRAGAVAIQSGVTTRPQEIALLAALGIERVDAIPRPRVAILSIGPELMRDAQPMQVSDANGPMLAALAAQAGAQVVVTAVVSGQTEELSAMLDSLAADADLLITSGGISDSAGDTLRSLLEYREETELWNVRLKPGKHFASGRIGRTPFISLPGNPVAALVGFVLFAQPAIDRLRGRNVRIGRISAISTEQLYGGEGRTDAIRGHLGIDAHARIAFSPAGSRGSGIVSSLREVDCLALIPENRSDIAAGEAVEVCPIGVSMFKDGAN